MQSSTQERTRSSSSGSQQIQVQTQGISPESITSIVLADGEHPVTNCKLVQFAVGEAHSPIYPPKLYPSLQFTDQRTGKTMWTTLRNVIAFSTE